ncbi:MAG: ABC transporter ATP-binding protein [Lachnospiraceae bacterium]|nr:ABC transporter ATP-binding protein [Lachnospiraceae bacterium]
MANALKVTDLCKTYITNKRQNNVLKNVTFSIEKGEMVAIMGPSGSGKSTLLYSVSGMDRPTAGEVMLDNKVITDMNEKELANVRLEKMGFVFQQCNMLKNLSIMDNIILPAYELSKGKKERLEINERCNELMRKLGISDIADNDITEVSGGQLQRACICRSLINNPKVIFADEPTGALNRDSSDEVMKEFNKLNNEGKTIMLVTHDMKVAAKCSRILYIVDGNIKGELNLGNLTVKSKEKDETVIKDMHETVKDRQRRVNNWLSEMGW